MTKALAVVLLLLVAVLGAQAYHGTYSELKETKQYLNNLAEANSSQPPTLVPFELPQADGESVSLADVADTGVVLLYVYSDEARDADLEQALADAQQASPDKVRVLALRTGATEEAAPVELASLGTTADDPSGLLAQQYQAQAPSIIVLKNRPIFHAAFNGGSTPEEVEEVVDYILEGDDMAQPLELGGCGGGCGEGGGGCGMGSPGGGEATSGGCPAHAITAEKTETSL